MTHIAPNAALAFSGCTAAAVMLNIEPLVILVILVGKESRGFLGILQYFTHG
jgi:hypothetical protein